MQTIDGIGLKYEMKLQHKRVNTAFKQANQLAVSAKQELPRCSEVRLVSRWLVQDAAELRANTPPQADAG